jgi:hypothetical protein
MQISCARWEPLNIDTELISQKVPSVTFDERDDSNGIGGMLSLQSCKRVQTVSLR